MPHPAADAPAGQVLVAAHYGDPLVGGAGNDTLVADRGSDVLTGGAGADLFRFDARPWNGAEVTDFQLGVDRLDIGALYEGGYKGSDPVADGYVVFESDGAGGTKVMLDADGPGAGHAWGSLVAVLDHVSPVGLTAAVVFGGAAPTGVSLTSTHYGDVLAGGPGADTLSAGQGPDVLTGGDGADLFVYSALPWNGGEIADFQPGVDRLDISALLQGGQSAADALVDGDVTLASDGVGGTKVMLDPDGPAGPKAPRLVTILDHVAPTGLTAAQLFGDASAAAVQNDAPAASAPAGTSIAPPPVASALSPVMETPSPAHAEPAASASAAVASQPVAVAPASPAATSEPGPSAGVPQEAPSVTLHTPAEGGAAHLPFAEAHGELHAPLIGGSWREPCLHWLLP
jgi:hypothetical protein